MSTKKYLTLFVIFVIGVSLSACKAKNNEKKEEPSNIPSVTEKEEPSNVPSVTITEKKETTYPVTLTGSDGQIVVLQQEPKRIISISPSITEMIYSLGVEEKLIARSEYCDYPTQALELPSIGSLYTPDIEKIIELEPDLIITSVPFDIEVQSQLNSFGIAVINLYEEKKIDGVYSMFETLGEAFNVFDRASKLIEDMKNEMNDLREKISTLTKRSVYYVVDFGDGGEFTAGGDTYIHGILTSAGGRNIAEDISGWAYSLESLLEADPDVIIVANYMYDSFLLDARYNTLSAVKNGAVYAIDNNLLDRQSIRNVQAIKEIASMLYKEAFE